MRLGFLWKHFNLFTGVRFETLMAIGFLKDTQVFFTTREIYTWALQNMKISTDIQILYLGVVVISSFVSGYMTSQSFFLDKGTSHRHLIFCHKVSSLIREQVIAIWYFGNPPKFEENHILCLKTSFPTQIHITLYFYNYSNPLVNRFDKILPKCALTRDYNVVNGNSWFWCCNSYFWCCNS